MNEEVNDYREKSGNTHHCSIGGWTSSAASSQVAGHPFIWSDACDIESIKGNAGVGKGGGWPSGVICQAIDPSHSVKALLGDHCRLDRFSQRKVRLVNMDFSVEGD